MYDANKIIPGLVLFFGLLAIPLWYNAITGEASYVPKPEIVTTEKQCVEPKEWMAENHMRLLSDWREAVVRQGVRTYVSSDGKEYNISLVGTCLDCHSNKAEFCDRCHSYAGVEPNCWACHEAPEKGQ